MRFRIPRLAKALVALALALVVDGLSRIALRLAVAIVSHGATPAERERLRRVARRNPVRDPDGFR